MNTATNDINTIEMQRLEINQLKTSIELLRMALDERDGQIRALNEKISEQRFALQSKFDRREGVRAKGGE